MACAKVAIFPGSRPRTDYGSVKELFCEWLASPEATREPRTLTDFGMAYGVHRATLHEWKQSDHVQDRVRFYIDRYLHLNYGEVAHAIVEACKAGSVPAMKLYLQYVLGWREGESAEQCSLRVSRNLIGAK